LICTQAGKQLEVQELREALKADKTLVFTGSKDVKYHDGEINALIVKWAKDYYKSWEVNPKSVEGDAFKALDVEAYIRHETSWSARQSNFTASAFDNHADASSVRWCGGVDPSLSIWPELPARRVRNRLLKETRSSRRRRAIWAIFGGLQLSI